MDTETLSLSTQLDELSQNYPCVKLNQQPDQETYHPRFPEALLVSPPESLPLQMLSPLKIMFEDLCLLQLLVGVVEFLVG